MQQTSTEQHKFKVGGGSAIAVLVVLTLLYMINFADPALFLSHFSRSS